MKSKYQSPIKQEPATVDKTFAARFRGKARATIHRVRGVLKARRNGVCHVFTFAPEGRALRLYAQSERPDGITIARTLKVGPRGGLFQERHGKRRYLKASMIGRGRV